MASLSTAHAWELLVFPTPAAVTGGRSLFDCKRVSGCDASRRFYLEFAGGCRSMALMVPQMIYLQELVQLHTLQFCLLKAMLSACFDSVYALIWWI